MWFEAIETDYKKWREREIQFKVPKSWFEKWFSNKRKGKETNGNIEKERYETSEDFLSDWILDDTYEMYNDAIKDNKVIEIRPISECFDIL